MTIGYADVTLRLVVTVALCGALGLERESRDQAAGLRTHILVGLGAALFTIAGDYAFFGAPAVRSIPPGSPRRWCRASASWAPGPSSARASRSAG